ncbi:hypothetical protein EDC96DRAFT_579704 [Choanephora cucurbitarum]|nr:hypothetical protein EDC96DRAFT_579704 [Choanephora cucurbitarum]
MRQLALVTFALVACLVDSTCGETQTQSKANLKRDLLGINSDVTTSLPTVDNLLDTLTFSSSHKRSKDATQFRSQTSSGAGGYGQRGYGVGAGYRGGASAGGYGLRAGSGAGAGSAAGTDAGYRGGASAGAGAGAGYGAGAKYSTAAASVARAGQRGFGQGASAYTSLSKRNKLVDNLYNAFTRRNRSSGSKLSSERG